MMKYLDALQLVKASFLDGSENSILSDYIIQYFRKTSLDILDIGIGDGQNAWKLANALQRAGLSPTVTGVDPLLDSERIVNLLYPSFLFTRARFEDFETQKQFDVVIAAQSLYYMREVHQSIQKMLRLTKKGGLSVIVLWSEQCAINRLYRPCNDCEKFNDHNDFVTAEGVFKYLQRIPEVKNAQFMYFPGRVFLSLWKSMPAALSGACTVFTRSDSHALLHEHVLHLRNLLKHFNDVEQRVNGIIFIQK